MQMLAIAHALVTSCRFRDISHMTQCICARYSKPMSEKNAAPPSASEKPDAGTENPAATGDRALRQRTQTFVEGWRQTLGNEWIPERASAMYDDLERIAAMAEEQSASQIAGPALELTVYLCSFVDNGASPNSAQRQGLEQLIERLAAVGGETAARRGARKGGSAAADEGASHRHLFYLRRNELDLPGLASALGKQGYIVRPFDEREVLLLALEEVSPDVLLIDEAFVPDVHALTEAVQRQRPSHKDPSLCLVLAEETDITRTLAVQRSGADAVVVERDPIALVLRLDTLWAQRRALGYRVLIVEDDRGQAKFCESILRHRGMLTAVCEDPVRVPATLDEFKPDLVLMDLYLPGSNGIEVAQRIRESGHAFMPIVFLSGEHDLDLRFDAIRMGADDFITKPVKPRHLVTTVESRIKRARHLSTAHSDSRGERRGSLAGRDVLAREVLRAAREEQERCPVLAMIAVDDIDDVQRSIGFTAAGTLAQQLAASLAAEIRGARTLCAWGDLKFLVLLHADDELSARQQLESLRQKLETRPWLSEEAPVRLHLSLGALRLGADLSSVENVLDRVRSMLATAQEGGGARCEIDLRTITAESNEDPQLRLVRAILRAPSVRGTAHFDFQPLVPLGGQTVGQYEARMHLKPPKSSQSLLLQRADYLPIARELGMVAHADRHLLRGVLELVGERRNAEQELRLYLPIAVATLLDPAFAPWLGAELGAHGVPSNMLALEFDAEEIRAELARLRGALDSLQRVGVRLALSARGAVEGGLSKLLAVEAFGIVKFARDGDAGTKADAAWERWSRPMAEARSLGKVTVASSLAGVGDLGVLLKLGAHYVQGDSLSGWLPDWSFDFAEAVL
jgi:PleD family two-component response regulator/EAL domain-containing protein (putative c-di-GMP-specific phosphodiesterase class I)